MPFDRNLQQAAGWNNSVNLVLHAQLLAASQADGAMLPKAMAPSNQSIPCQTALQWVNTMPETTRHAIIKYSQQVDRTFQLRAQPLHVSAAWGSPVRAGVLPRQTPAGQYHMLQPTVEIIREPTCWSCQPKMSEVEWNVMISKARREQLAAAGHHLPDLSAAPVVNQTPISPHVYKADTSADVQVPGLTHSAIPYHPLRAVPKYPRPPPLSPDAAQSPVGVVGAPRCDVMTGSQADVVHASPLPMHAIMQDASQLGSPPATQHLVPLPGTVQEMSPRNVGMMHAAPVQQPGMAQPQYMQQQNVVQQQYMAQTDIMQQQLLDQQQDFTQAIPTPTTQVDAMQSDMQQQQQQQPLQPPVLMEDMQRGAMPAEVQTTPFSLAAPSHAPVQTTVGFDGVTQTVSASTSVDMQQPQPPQHELIPPQSSKSTGFCGCFGCCRPAAVTMPQPAPMAAALPHQPTPQAPESQPAQGQAPHLPPLPSPPPGLEPMNTIQELHSHGQQGAANLTTRTDSHYNAPSPAISTSLAQAAPVITAQAQPTALVGAIPTPTPVSTLTQPVRYVTVTTAQQATSETLSMGIPSAVNTNPPPPPEKTAQPLQSLNAVAATPPTTMANTGVYSSTPTTQLVQSSEQPASTTAQQPAAAQAVTAAPAPAITVPALAAGQGAPVVVATPPVPSVPMPEPLPSPVKLAPMAGAAVTIDTPAAAIPAPRKLSPLGAPATGQLQQLTRPGASQPISAGGGGGDVADTAALVKKPPQQTYDDMIEEDF